MSDHQRAEAEKLWASRPIGDTEWHWAVAQIANETNGVATRRAWKDLLEEDREFLLDRLRAYRALAERAGVGDWTEHEALEEAAAILRDLARMAGDGETDG